MLNDYIENIANKICYLMGIKFVKEKYINIYNWDYDENDPRGACIFRDENDKDRFVFVDASPQTDITFVYFAVQCNENERRKND